VYRDLAAQGHEVGLHLHPAEQGYDEFLGVYGPEEQATIILQAAEALAEAFGARPLAFVPGYHSANDHTFPVLEALGFRHGSVSMPTRDLPHLACVWGHSPLDPHYAHRFHRSLAGDVDFVDIPGTVDVDSRMWGGAHPQDLRVELVDAKNHWYTIHKNVQRLVASGVALPVKHLQAITHNIFDFLDPRDFRRETLEGIITAARQICEEAGARLVPATLAEIAAEHRARVPRPQGGQRLRLDERARGGWTHLTSARD
jgi:peptidoglycan/xylan/chitin deacetylase (PgdA/CDA1 family)